jgi:uncharacterized protein
MDTLDAPPVKQQQKAQKIKTIGRRVLIYLFLLYAIPIVVLAFEQRALIFKPDHYTLAEWKTNRMAATGESVTLHTRDGNTVYAVFGRAQTTDGKPIADYSHRPTLLYFHGNSSDLLEDMGDFKTFRRMGVNVMMPDYVGFGASTGLPSEIGCDESGEAAYDYLRSRKDIDPTHIVITGHSLGTAVAINLAAHEIQEKHPVAGMAIFSGFTSMPEEAHNEYPIYPVWLLRLIDRYPFESESKISKVTCPVLIAHSRSDAKVPYWMAGRLSAACPGKVTRLSIDQVPHGEIFSTGAPVVIPAFRAFINNLP